MMNSIKLFQYTVSFIHELTSTKNYKRNFSFALKKNDHVICATSVEANRQCSCIQGNKYNFTFCSK